jgi:hypothetical protein
MGSTPTGDPGAAPLASASPHDMTIVRGIPGCAVASDRL